MDRHVAVIQRVAEHGAEHDDERDQRVQQPVDRPLQRGARMPERARLAGDPRREAVLADGRDPVGAGPLDHERPRANLLTDGAPGRLRLAGQDRLVEPQVGGGQDRPVGDHLIARREQHDVVDDDLLDLDRADSAVAPHVRVRRDQQREPVERPLRPHLLADPDRRVGDDDPEEQRVARVPEDQRHHPERGEDQVEHRQDVRADDARVRPARRAARGTARAREPPRRLSLASARRPAQAAAARRLGLDLRGSTAPPNRGVQPAAAQQQQQDATAQNRDRDREQMRQASADADVGC